MTEIERECYLSHENISGSLVPVIVYCHYTVYYIVLYCSDSYCDCSDRYCNDDVPKYEHMFTGRNTISEQLNIICVQFG